MKNGGQKVIGPALLEHVSTRLRNDAQVKKNLRGGRDDSLIDSEGLRETVVVFSEAEAEEKGLEIDHDDSHAAVPDWEFENFALLIHGTQPKGSEASKALQLLRKNKVKHSYNRKAKK